VLGVSVTQTMLCVVASISLFMLCSMSLPRQGPCLGIHDGGEMILPASHSCRDQSTEVLLVDAGVC
jgi:hypothetical protein